MKMKMMTSSGIQIMHDSNHTSLTPLGIAESYLVLGNGSRIDLNGGRRR